MPYDRCRCQCQVMNWWLPGFPAVSVSVSISKRHIHSSTLFLVSISTRKCWSNGMADECVYCDFQFIWASFFPLDTEPFRKQTFSLVLEAPMVSDADIVTLSTEVSHTTRWFSFITVTLYLQVGYHTSHLSTCCQWLSQSIFTKITHDFTTTTTSWHWIAYYVLMCS